MATTKEIKINTNEATNNIDKLSKALDNAKEKSEGLNNSIEETKETLNKPMPTENVEQFGKSLDNASEKAEQLKVNTDNVQKVSAGLAGSVQLAVGALALMGTESEEVNEIMAKLSAVMVITNGLKSIGEGAAAMVQLTKATKLAEGAQKAFNLQLLKNPYMIIAAAILAIVAATVKMIGSMEDAAVATRGFDNAIQELNRDLEDMKASEDFAVKLAQAEGKTQKQVLEIRKKGATERLNAQIKEYNELLRKKQEADGDITEEEQNHINELGDAINKGRRELKTIRDDIRVEEYKETLQHQKELRDAEEKANEERLQRQKEYAAKRREQLRKEKEDRESISEELRVAKLNGQQKELDDVDKWYRESQEKAHGNTEILIQIEEEKNRRISEINERFHQEEREREEQRLQEEKDARFNQLDTDLAKSEYDLNTGNISQGEFDQQRLQIEQERLTLIDTGTQAYWQQLEVIRALNEEIGENQQTALYDSMDAWGKWRTNSAKSVNQFRKDWEKMDMAEQVATVSSAMDGFGNALNNMFSAIMAGMDENSEEYKALAITQTIITTLMGMVSAYSSAFNPANAWMTIIGQSVMAGVQMAAVLTTGIINIQKIASADENTNLSSAAASTVSGTKVSENAVQGVNGMDIQSLPNAVGDSQTGTDNKTYVVATDINRKQKDLSNKKTSVKF